MWVLPMSDESSRASWDEFRRELGLPPPPAEAERREEEDRQDAEARQRQDRDRWDEIERLLGLARDEAERREEEDRQDAVARQRQERIGRAFAEVRDFTIQSLAEELGHQPDLSEYCDHWAGRIVALMSVLKEEGLAQRLDELPPVPDGDRGGAKRIAVEVYRRGGTGDRARTADLLRQVGEIRGELSRDVNGWLRRGLEPEIRGLHTLTKTADGICWPIAWPDDPDPVATLREACAIARDALEHPERFQLLGGVPVHVAVVRQLRSLATDVARRRGRIPPELPEEVCNATAARSAAGKVLAWCDAEGTLPADPAVRILDKIRRERMILGLMHSCPSGQFDWQAGVNRLWRRWDELFPCEVRPGRPVCANYADASDAVVALLEALQAVESRRGGVNFPNLGPLSPKERTMPKPPQEKAKVLFFAANPTGTKPLALDEESREIKAKIRAADYRDALELITEWAVRPDDLLQFLNQHKPHVVHFSGHGSADAEIILQDDGRQPEPVSQETLEALFKALKGQIRVVFLNACFTLPQAKAIVREIDCAIGMSRAVGDQAAITFAASFYRALGFGASVQNAFDQAKVALKLKRIPEEGTPQLIVKSGVDADKVFVVNPR
jgi:hypothetical protein